MTEMQAEQTSPSWQRIRPAQSYARLDQFLAEQFPQVTRSRWQKMIERGEALVDGQNAKASQKVDSKVEVRVLLNAEPVSVGLVPEAIPLDILFEDEEIIVINKQPGLVVHPAHGHWSGTLVNALVHHCGTENLSRGRAVIGGELRPGIVHRIDKNTSGVIVVAKSDGAQAHLARQFSDHSMRRRYQGICFGVLPPKGEWNAGLGRDRANRQRMAVVPEGKHAVTKFRRLESFRVASLFEAELLTGRTHQIRVHFAHNGFPLAGDSMYLNAWRSARRTKEEALRLLRKHDGEFVHQLEALAHDRGRQMLHAAYLGIRHPASGELMHFSAPLPADMQAVLDGFRALDFCRTE